MKKIFISIAFCIGCLCGYSQDSMNKKMENKSDKMVKKMDNPSDKMNKKISDTPEKRSNDAILKRTDSLYRKSAPKPVKKKPV